MKTKEEILGLPFYPYDCGGMIECQSRQESLKAMEEYSNLMYNQALEDVIKYGQVRCTTNERSITASVYGTVKGESFSVDKESILKLRK